MIRLRVRPRVFVLGLCLMATASVGFDYWIDATPLPNLDPATSRVVLDRDGWLLRPYLASGDVWRLPVDVRDVDPRYLEYLVRYEDKRFYQHHGVDYLAVIRAAWQAVRHDGIVSGASTLTMQVARLLEQGGTRKWSGKLRQIRLALALERRLAKTDILDLYLKLAPFGGNLEGVRAASLSYFGKEPARLTTAESALLVGLPQSPERRRPDRHPGEARAARDAILERLAGYRVISPQEAAAAMKEPVPGSRQPFPAIAPHLADRALRERPDRQAITTTIDRSLQQSLEQLVAGRMSKAADGRSMAIMVMDHVSGEVRAYVGSGGYLDYQRDGFIDMIQAVRSPGSTLKPLVFGLAFDQGIAHPETMIEDRPVSFDAYRPENFDNKYRGSIRIRDALQLSLNTPTVSLLHAMGSAKLMTRLRAAGVEPRLPGNGPPGLAIGLGGIGLTLQDLVVLYAAIANGGVAETPAIYADQPPTAAGGSVISDTAAWYVSDILRGIPGSSGTHDEHFAYKTGTSYGYRDAWAIGFDGRHVLGVWTGRPDGGSIPGALGGEAAAPVLFEALGRLKQQSEPLPGPPRSALLVSNASLPMPLRRFRHRTSVFDANRDAPSILFPHDGSRVSLGAATRRQPLVLKVGDGIPPFTWLADGRPILIAVDERQSFYTPDGPGHISLSVVDSQGLSQNVGITVD